MSADNGQREPWLRELLESSSGGRDVVQVVFRRSSRELPDLASLAGVAAINCGGIDQQMLRAAGFSYVRSFAVIPTLSQPRWFVPLDSRRVAAGAFGLWTPFRTAAKLKYGAARLAARMGLAGWCGDRLVIAQRAMPPLERVIRRLFADQPVHLALSSGSPPPTRNYKLAVAVLDSRGSLLAFGKLPGPHPQSESSVRREAQVLSALSRRPGPVSAPRLLFAGPVGSTFLALTSPLEGRRPGVRLTSAHRRFLDGMVNAQVKPLGDTELVQSMLGQRALLSTRPDLHSILTDLLPQLRALAVPTCVVHGDFAPWNLRVREDRLAAFDWESASLDGPVLFDEIHHELATGYLLEALTPAQAFERMAALARRASTRLLPPTTATVIQIVYLLNFLMRRFAEGYDDEDGQVQWSRALLHQLVTTSNGARLGPRGGHG